MIHIPGVEELIAGAHGEEHLSVRELADVGRKLSNVFVPISIVEAHPVVASGIDKLVTGCTLKIARL